MRCTKTIHGLSLIGCLLLVGCANDGAEAAETAATTTSADANKDAVEPTAMSDANETAATTVQSAVESAPSSEKASPDDSPGAAESGERASSPDADPAPATTASSESEPVDSSTQASDGDSPAAEGNSFEACVAALEPMCSYDRKETACSSLITTTIPLSDGGTWGNNEIVGGPYGAFVAWNQGAELKNPVNASESTCDLLAASFGEPAEVTADVLDLRGADLSLYTIFRPACMRDGETYPVITWGNGTCGQSGGYAALLATVASHGFVVIAANSRFTDAGNNEMLRALDLAEKLNATEDSVFYQRLDLEKIGAMGHSQGSSATAHAAADPRIKAVILWNGGLSADKPFLAVSGDRDIGGYTPQQMDSAVQGSSQPGAWLYYHQVLETGGNVTGHLTLMEQPERVWEPTVAWWKYVLQGDEDARKMFSGADCGLCAKPDELEFGANANLP